MGDHCCALHDANRTTDPTHTTTIRRRFEGELARRFRRLKGLVNQSLIENDALGLRRQTIGDQALRPGEFAFNRSGQKVSGFMEWLREQQAEGILDVTPGTPVREAADNAWTNIYVRRAYDKGVSDAAGRMRRAGATVEPSWVNSAFNRPIHADRLGLIYTRTFEQLKGITETMDQQISRVLAEGVATGQNPMQIARTINERVDKIGITRARVLARTEVISAHAEASINSYEEAGLEGVEIEAEVSTAGDGRVCEECERLARNGPYTLQRARGMIPAHPRCRCAVLPAIKDDSGIILS